MGVVFARTSSCRNVLCPNVTNRGGGDVVVLEDSGFKKIEWGGGKHLSIGRLLKVRVIVGVKNCCCS